MRKQFEPCHPLGYQQLAVSSDSEGSFYAASCLILGKQKTTKQVSGIEIFSKLKLHPGITYFKNS